jgi:cytochrome b subunit of formate dehydrogenase
MRRIERFCKTTRWFHWSFVLPFLGLAGTGAALALRETLGLAEDATRTLVRAHEAIAAVWLLAPPLVLLSGQTRDALADLTLPFRLTRDDLRWLALQPLAALGRAELPPAGKLNGGQKMNGLLAAGLGLGLASSGLWLWQRPGALVPWFLHLALFTAWLPAFAGHFYLAVLNPGTRHALRAMWRGDVDLDWAAHHHPRWVAESGRGRGPARPPSTASGAPALAAVALADERA